MAEIEKPIFIVGVPRSGTTPVYHILAQHPDVAWFSKRTLMKMLNPEFLNFAYLRRRIFGIRNYTYPLDEFGYRFFTTVEPPAELGYLWDEVFRGYWNAKVDKDKVKVLKSLMIQTLNEEKKKRFLVKVPKLSILIPSIIKEFPDAKFIHVIRDGKAVVNSMIKRSKENPNGYFGIPLKGFNISAGDAIKKHALQWKQVIEEIRTSSKLLSNNQFFEFKYEGFVESTDHYIEKILDFCELPQHKLAYRKNGKDCHTEQLKSGSWEMVTLKVLDDPNKKYIDNKKNSEIRKYLEPTLSSLGYN